MAILKIKDENGNVTSVPVVKSLVVKEYVEGGDISKFCNQNEVTDTRVVTCEYVNENEHDVEVQLSSDTITDFSGITIETWGGNNFFNLEKATNADNYVRHSLSHIRATDVLPIKVKPNTNYVLHRNTYDESGCNLAVANDSSYMSVQNARSRGITSGEDGMLYIYFAKPSSSAAEQATLFSGNHYTDISLREDYSTRLDYYADPTHIQGRTYTVNSDGTVKVKSMSGTMNIVCDSLDVNITAKYYLSPTADYDKFWDRAQLYGNRTDYQWKFAGNTFSDETFRPKYDIKPSGSIANMFYQSNNIRDIEDCLNKAGVVMDLSGATNMDAAFYYASYLTKLPPLDVSNVTSMSNTFRYCSKLKSLTLLNINPSCVFSSTFTNCNNLTEFRCTGTIGNTFTFSHTTIPNESVQNIIDCLADLTGATAKTLTLSTNTKAAMTEEQIAAVTAKNWTLA